MDNFHCTSIKPHDASTHWIASFNANVMNYQNIVMFCYMHFQKIFIGANTLENQ